VARAGTTACGGTLEPPFPDISTTTPDISTTTPAPEPATPSGEVWQWALGRNVWTDPDLQQYTQSLGDTHDTDVNVQSEGFQLTADSSGTVVAVTLFNDETALGMPQSETSYSA
jgi:hypothetical protein